MMCMSCWKHIIGQCISGEWYELLPCMGMSSDWAIAYLKECVQKVLTCHCTETVCVHSSQDKSHFSIGLHLSLGVELKKVEQ